MLISLYDSPNTIQSALNRIRQMSKIRKITYRNFAGDFLSLRKSWIDYKL